MTQLATQAFSQLVKHGRIPRLSSQHYFIEDEGLHSRVLLQNFYSTFWPHIEEPVTATVDLYAPTGEKIGRRKFKVEPFGSLFVEAADLLEGLGSSAKEGSLTIDLAPSKGVLKELSSFPLDDPWALRIGTPFWMAYYDDQENYMYVHSIDRYMGKFQGVPRPVGWFLTRKFGDVGTRWRGGRLLDTKSLCELHIVSINHSADTRTTTIGLFDAGTDTPIWTQEVTFGPHELRRFNFDADEIRTLGENSSGEVRVGLDPLLTMGGKPYIMLRYGSGPLSLHHG